MIFSADWWSSFGDDALDLRIVAVKVLSQTCTSSGCERNWSTFSLIHTKTRNRLTSKKLEKLVYVHYNMRLRAKNIENSENRARDQDYEPINLDYIFADDDPLEPWLVEVEDPALKDLDIEELDEQIQGVGQARGSQSRPQRVQSSDEERGEPHQQTRQNESSSETTPSPLRRGRDDDGGGGTGGDGAGGSGDTGGAGGHYTTEEQPPSLLRGGDQFWRISDADDPAHFQPPPPQPNVYRCAGQGQKYYHSYGGAISSNPWQWQGWQQHPYPPPPQYPDP